MNIKLKAKSAIDATKVFLGKNGSKIAVYGGLGLIAVGTGIMIKQAINGKVTAKTDDGCKDELHGAKEVHDYYKEYRETEQAMKDADYQSFLQQEMTEDDWAKAEKEHNKFTRQAYLNEFLSYGQLFGAPLLIFAGGTFCVIKGYRTVEGKLAALYVAYDRLQKWANANTSLEGEESTDFNLSDEEKEKQREESHHYWEYFGEEGPNPYDITDKPFSFFFSKYLPNGKENPLFKENMEANHWFIDRVMATANARLRQRGWILLNEVLMMLGHPPIPEGWDIGWVYDDSGRFQNDIKYVRQQFLITQEDEDHWWWEKDFRAEHSPDEDVRIVFMLQPDGYIDKSVYTGEGTAPKMKKAKGEAVA